MSILSLALFRRRIRRKREQKHLQAHHGYEQTHGYEQAHGYQQTHGYTQAQVSSYPMYAEPYDGHYYDEITMDHVLGPLPPTPPPPPAAPPPPPPPPASRGARQKGRAPGAKTTSQSSFFSDEEY